MTLFPPSNEMIFSLLIYPDRAPSRWEVAGLEDSPPQDTFERIMEGKVGG